MNLFHVIIIRIGQNKERNHRASRTSGIENIQVTQFLGDMYLELNVYDNIITFSVNLLLPTFNNCQNYYKYYLEDSALDNDWCYKLRYIPKRKRDLCLLVIFDQ